jgi:uncharacterized repeat protein (TIGR01451 family)
MKRRLSYAAAVAFAVSALLPLVASPAWAHTGTATATCSAVTYTYQSFPTGSNTVHETVKIDGVVAATHDATFQGSSGTDVVAIHPSAGSHAVVAAASWNTNGAVGSISVPSTISCPPGDVAVTKSADVATIDAGGTAAFTIVVSSVGQSTARRAGLVDPLPAGLSWTKDNAACTISNNVLTCSFGDLAPGQRAVVHLTAPTTRANCGVISNTATVSADNDTNSANNRSTAQITVVCPAPCQASSTIRSNFNGTAIGGNDWIWFNAVVKVKGLGTSPVTITVRKSTITFGSTTVQVSNADLTFDPGATSATTAFDTSSNAWTTTVPTTGPGNTFLTGIGFHVPAAGLPGGINPVDWTATFGTTTPGISLQWQWAAAVYTSFGAPGALGVKPVDSNTLSVYKNSDHAGTPESFKRSVIGGARGGGGSNFTGSYSGTAAATLACT